MSISRTKTRIGYLAAGALALAAVTGITFADKKPANAAPTTATPYASTATGLPQTSGPLAELNALPVKGRAPKTDYTRAQFGPAWSDDVPVQFGHNGCDTRNDILRRDLTDITIKPGTHGCVVSSGTLQDPYTGKTIHFTRGNSTSTAVQIDHIVPLSQAWQTGAQQLSADQRRALANDPLNLLAVDGPANEQKSDGDAATWLPQNRSVRCTYVARQIQVKTTYHLWVTPAEKTAMNTVLNNC